MKLSFLLLLCLHSCFFSANATTLNYCGDTVIFNTEPFDRKILEADSKKDDCRENKIQLLMTTKTGKLKAELELINTSDYQNGINSFIPANSNGSFYFDNEKFEKAIHSKESYRPFAKYFLSKKYYATVYTNKTPNGVLVVNTINFLHDDNTLYKVAKFITFFKSGSYSVQYIGDPVSISDADSLRMQIAVEQLFLSMKIDW